MSLINAANEQNNTDPLKKISRSSQKEISLCSSIHKEQELEENTAENIIRKRSVTKFQDPKF